MCFYKAFRRNNLGFGSEWSGLGSGGKEFLKLFSEFTDVSSEDWVVFTLGQGCGLCEEWSSFVVKNVESDGSESEVSNCSLVTDKEVLGLVGVETFGDNLGPFWEES